MVKQLLLAGLLLLAELLLFSRLLLADLMPGLQQLLFESCLCCRAALVSVGVGTAACLADAIAALLLA